MRRLLICLFLLISQVGEAAEVILVGIAGGTGSGKTTIARKIYEAFPNDVVVITQDCYYRDLALLPLEERSQVNFDHPNSIEFELLVDHLNSLKEGHGVCLPQYSFKEHRREPQFTPVESRKIIVVEGILLFAIPEVRELFDLKLFVDTDDDVRLLRRIGRDMKERGRTFESVREQYLATVKPMHALYVAPSKAWADVIIPMGGENVAALDMVIARLREQL